MRPLPRGDVWGFYASPGGVTELSPALQRWERWGEMIQVPEGRPSSHAQSSGLGIDIRFFAQPVRTSPSACNTQPGSATDKDRPRAGSSGPPAVAGIPNRNSVRSESTPADTASAV